MGYFLLLRQLPILSQPAILPECLPRHATSILPGVRVDSLDNTHSFSTISEFTFGHADDVGDVAGCWLMTMMMVMVMMMQT